MTKNTEASADELTIDTTIADEPAPRTRDEHIGLAIELIKQSLQSAQTPPGEAVEALAFILGRIIAFASQPGQVEANVESVKASIIMSIAAHRRAAADGQQQAG